MSEKNTVIHMKDFKSEVVGSCTKRNHASILLFCLGCTVVYLYLYSNLTFRTIAVNDMMKDTLNDLQLWKDKVEGWVKSFSNDQSTERTNNPGDKVKTSLTTTAHAALNTQNNDNTQLKFTSLPSVATKSTLSTVTKPKSSSNRDSNYSSEDFYKTLSSIKSIKDRISALKDAINNGEAEPLITLFTTWPIKKEKFLVHNSTVKNWRALSPFVNAVLFSDEPPLSSLVTSLGWNALPVTKTAVGIPILKYMYIQAKSKFKSKFYAYSNGDILFTKGLIETLLSVLNFANDTSKPLMIVGQRTNVQDVTEKEASSFENIEKASKRGKLFTSFAEDYFITNAIYPWKDCAEVVVGRRAYDNWLVVNARKRGHVTIDATKTMLALHQTTKAGNYEGHAVPNSNYNDRLLSKQFRRVYYGSGLTSCTSYYTQPNSEEVPELITRKVHKGCFPL